MNVPTGCLIGIVWWPLHVVTLPARECYRRMKAGQTFAGLIMLLWYWPVALVLWMIEH